MYHCHSALWFRGSAWAEFGPESHEISSLSHSPFDLVFPIDTRMTKTPKSNSGDPRLHFLATTLNLQRRFQSRDLEREN